MPFSFLPTCSEIRYKGQSCNMGSTLLVASSTHVLRTIVVNHCRMSLVRTSLSGDGGRGILRPFANAFACFFFFLSNMEVSHTKKCVERTWAITRKPVALALVWGFAHRYLCTNLDNHCRVPWREVWCRAGAPWKVLLCWSMCTTLNGRLLQFCCQLIPRYLFHALLCSRQNSHKPRKPGFHSKMSS